MRGWCWFGRAHQVIVVVVCLRVFFEEGTRGRVGLRHCDDGLGEGAKRSSAGAELGPAKERRGGWPSRSCYK